MKSIGTALCITISLILAPMCASAVTVTKQSAKVQIVGLFKDTAIVHVSNKKPQTMRVGQTGPYGIKLVAANSQHAIFDYKGRLYKQGLDQQPVIYGTYAARDKSEARIMENNGVYQVPGTINNQLVSFLVDTGASYISMNTAHAQRLGIEYLRGRETLMNTANGQTHAYLVNLKRVKIGEIEVNNVQAAVMDNISSDEILLGMSFLKNVNFRNEGRLMLLQKTNK